MKVVGTTFIVVGGNPRPLALDDCPAILHPKSLISLLYPKLSHLKTVPFTQHIPVYLMFGSAPGVRGFLCSL